MRDPNMLVIPPYLSAHGQFHVPPTDAQWEGIWRMRVRENEERRKIRTPVSGVFIPSFLRLQAD